MEVNIYSIKLITNLHAGSGDAGYGVVDKLSQRDVTTKLPTINASGIKGALREYFEKYLKCDWAPDVFGDDNNGSKGALVGTYRFMSADILCLPVPAPVSPYYQLVYDGEHIAKVASKLSLLNVNNSNLIEPGWVDDAAKFKEASDELAVIARNHLDNGQSKNLWYEEVVPHQSVFLLAIQYPANDVNITEFNSNLHNKVVQIGGNATVGYGLCSFKKIN